MIKLDFHNTAEIVFKDPGLRRLLPEFRPLFDAWLRSVRTPSQRQLGKKAILDFLVALDDHHLKIIAAHVGTEVSVERLNYNIVENIETHQDALVESLGSHCGLVNFAVARGRDTVSVCLW